MAVSSKFALTCAAGIGCAGSIPYVIKYRCSNPKERWVTPEAPFLTCTGERGSSISISLAFRNEEGGKKSSEKNLYVKGFDNKTGKEVKFDEEIKGQCYGGGEQERLTELDWTLKIFKNTGTTWLLRASDESLINDQYGHLTCSGKGFEIKKDGLRNKKDWERTVAKITFDIINSCEEKSGKRVCDIEIAEGVGLKWGTNFTPKAHFCKSSK